MEDARQLTLDILAEDATCHIAQATLGDTGICIWERDCVLFATRYNDEFELSEDTLFVTWAAGSFRAISDACKRSGMTYVIFQRELNRDVPSSKMRKYRIDRFYRLSSRYGN